MLIVLWKNVKICQQYLTELEPIACRKFFGGHSVFSIVRTHATWRSSHTVIKIKTLSVKCTLPGLTGEHQHLPQNPNNQCVSRHNALSSAISLSKRRQRFVVLCEYYTIGICNVRATAVPFILRRRAYDQNQGSCRVRCITALYNRP